MPLTSDPPFDRRGCARVNITISLPLHERLRAMRESLERRFRLRLDDDGLVEYLCCKALDLMEEWDRRARWR